MTAVRQAAPVEHAAGRETADLLIDAGRLSELVGAPVRATRLRHKPGLSTVGVLLPQDATVLGWVQATRADHLDKLRNALRRAADRGQQVHVLRVPDAGAELHLAHGDLGTDPRLQRGLDALRTAYPCVREAVADGALTVLRYNPTRRLVLRRQEPGQDPCVIRVTAHRQHAVGRVPAALAEAGLPVVQPLPGRGGFPSRRVSAWPWYGTGHLGAADLDPADRLAAARETGAALARLHAATHLLDGAHPPFGGAAATVADDPHAVLGPLVGDLAQLDRCAADRMADLVHRLATRTGAMGPVPELVPVHGDFSADQVLVGGPGGDGIRLIDFDRAGVGPRALDLGSFAAVELLEKGASLDDLPLTGGLLEGYRAAGAVVPTTEELRVWTARALLARVSEPFRAADPDWVDGIHRRLDQVGEVLAR